MSTESITPPGYYGKVPTHGDFVGRSLPRSFIDPWDTWLQEAINASRQQLGSQWLHYYLTSPLYRFILSPGICGDSSWLGVLMPSVDKVGRYYPLTIALPEKEGMNPFLTLQKKNSWFNDIEKLALSCLNDDFNLENFNRGIDSSELAGSSSDITRPQMYEQARHPAWRHVLSSVEALPDLMPSMLDTLLREQCFAYSVWWTQGSEVVAPSLLICTGLPPFDGLSAMFDGNWQRWGWEGKRYSAPFLDHQGKNG